jgi:hypothetical protein
MESADNIEERALASPVRTDEPENLALIYVEAHIA